MKTIKGSASKKLQFEQKYIQRTLATHVVAIKNPFTKKKNNRHLLALDVGIHQSPGQHEWQESVTSRHL
jgi:hypothetical protein